MAALRLLDGWKTRLNGLTAPEARALFFSGLPGPAGELGLGDEAAQAELKLLAALPADWQAEARRMSSRFHLDPRGWFQPGYKPEFLKLVAEAVWSETRIAIRYESWKDVKDRVIEPLGLVLKGGVWYVVAQRDGNARTYRLSQIQALGPTGETFTRPKDFDLPAHWLEATKQFERDIYIGTARVRASETGRRKLRGLSDTVRLRRRCTDPRAGCRGLGGVRRADRGSRLGQPRIRQARRRRRGSGPAGTARPGGCQCREDGAAVRAGVEVIARQPNRAATAGAPRRSRRSPSVPCRCR